MNLGHLLFRIDISPDVYKLLVQVCTNTSYPFLFVDVLLQNVGMKFDEAYKRLEQPYDDGCRVDPIMDEATLVDKFVMFLASIVFSKKTFFNLFPAMI